MQTPNHTVITELLKPIKAITELCKTKLPDKDQIKDDLSTITASISLAPKTEDEDCRMQNFEYPKAKQWGKPDLSALQGEEKLQFHRNKRVIVLSLDSSDDEREPEPRQKSIKLNTTHTFLMKRGQEANERGICPVATKDDSLVIKVEPDKAMLPVTPQTGVKDLQPQTGVKGLLNNQVAASADSSKKRQRCMDCTDCIHFLFVQQNGPHACQLDGTKPKIRQCAAWQRFDRWKKKPGNSLLYSAWRLTVDAHGPKYASQKSVHDQIVQYMTLSNVDKAKGAFKI